MPSLPKRSTKVVRVNGDIRVVESDDGTSPVVPGSLRATSNIPVDRVAQSL